MAEAVVILGAVMFIVIVLEIILVVLDGAPPDMGNDD